MVLADSLFRLPITPLCSLLPSYHLLFSHLTTSYHQLVTPLLSLTHIFALLPPISLVSSLSPHLLLLLISSAMLLLFQLANFPLVNPVPTQLLFSKHSISKNRTFFLISHYYHFTMKTQELISFRFNLYSVTLFFFLLSIVIAGTIISTTYLFLDVITLNDANFEEKTQMTTGATTGRWFVKFYAPVRTILLIDMQWCGHCKRLAPTWEELAEATLNEVNVAEVNRTALSLFAGGCNPEPSALEALQHPGLPYSAIL